MERARAQVHRALLPNGHRRRRAGRPAWREAATLCAPVWVVMLPREWSVRGRFGFDQCECLQSAASLTDANHVLLFHVVAWRPQPRLRIISCAGHQDLIPILAAPSLPVPRRPVPRVAAAGGACRKHPPSAGARVCTCYSATAMQCSMARDDHECHRGPAGGGPYAHMRL